jgi:RNA polymerase sigma-70 factor, ECF subfamily
MHALSGEVPVTIRSVATYNQEWGSVDRVEREQEWTLLMHAAVAGDQEAYRRLLESLAPALRSIARRGFERFGAGNSEIEDVVQETLLAIHLKRGTWDRTKSVGPWVTAIARYKLVDCLRRRGRRADVQIDALVDSLADDLGNDGSDKRDVDRILEHLEGRQQDIVRSISIEGNSVRETAVRLGMTEVAVRVSLHRCLKSLAERYRQAAD